jgi:regulator of sirC expression with transglutaminase-like and TPR domain
MSGSPDLVLFSHLLRKPDKELDLERAALLIAEAEYPGLDIARYVALLDDLGAKVRLALMESGLRPGTAPVPLALNAVLQLLYRDMGFRGNVADYYDHRNSFLNVVLERRTGIPITLALVLIAVAKRTGLRLQGVSFPGHFLVRALSENGAPLIIDPFEGRVLSREEVHTMWEQITGEPGAPDQHQLAQALAPASKRQIIARMLNNLRCIYEVRGDGRRLCQVLARLAVVTPSEEMERRLERATVAPPAPRISIN